MKHPQSIEDILALERIEKNIFRGQSQDIGTPQVYGGQVLSQAIAAAQRTVEGRLVHSVHSYFLRKGDFTAPIIYEVDRNREGRSFTARRVVAIQHGQPIFTLAASFQIDEQGEQYQEAHTLPDINAAKLIPSKSSLISKDGKTRPSQFFDIRYQENDKPDSNNAVAYWIKTRKMLADSVDIHREVLAYISDFGLLFSALKPHGYNVFGGKGRAVDWVLASIDHAIWFHRAFRADQWLYYRCDPISTGSSRGLARGRFFDTGGNLVVSTMQEGLMRRRSHPIDEY